MLTEQEKAEREGMLGASDLPVVAGVSPYKAPIELYYQMTGQLARYNEEETAQQMWGSRFEPIIAEVAAEQLGVKIRRSPVRTNPAYPFLSCHLDYEIVGNLNGPGVMEIKRREGKAFEELPDDITVQVTGQLAVTNREWGIVAVLFSWGDLKTFEVRRDKEMEAAILHLAATFMRHVTDRHPPDHIWQSGTVDLLKRLYPMDNGQVLSLDGSYLADVMGFLTAKAQLKEIENRKAQHEGRIKEAMGTTGEATCGQYKLSWKSTKDSREFDRDRFKAEQAELWSQYQKTVPGYRRFLVKARKEPN